MVRLWKTEVRPECTRIECTFESYDVRVTKDTVPYLQRWRHPALRLLTVDKVVRGTHGDFRVALRGAYNQWVHLSEWSLSVQQVSVNFGHEFGAIAW